MKIVIDMSLPPSWAAVLEAGGHQTVHWSGVGSPKASDRDILLWARQRAYIVFPHDLDFGAILAALAQFAADLARGSLVSVDEASGRARILPIN
jgi:predicted nuclease of predicted toxin-antitoxin system